jgi:hypothetical protein
MKKYLLIALFLAAAAAMTGCVHPIDQDIIAPAPATAAG